MSLASRVDALALRIGQEIKAARAELRPVSAGGTNSSATPTAGGAGYGTGTAHAYTAAGVSKQVLASNGAGAPSFQSLDLTYLPDAWVKKAVKAATTANITLSGPQTIDGVSCVAGDRVLVKNQTTASQNGIYDVAAGAWVRSAGSNTAAEVAGATVSCDQGAVNGGVIWSNSFLTTHVLGTTAMNWTSDTQRGLKAGTYGNLGTKTITAQTANAQTAVAATNNVTYTCTRATRVRVTFAAYLDVTGSAASSIEAKVVGSGATVFDSVTLASTMGQLYSWTVGARKYGSHNASFEVDLAVGTTTFTVWAMRTTSVTVGVVANLALDVRPVGWVSDYS